MPADAPASDGPIDTSDMIAIHAVFRDVFGSAATQLATVAPGDAERRALLGSYYANVLALLQVHHEGEDELLWPRLTERLPQHAELFADMESQHHGLHASVARAGDALGSWADGDDAADGLVAALDDVHGHLVPHLDQEEREVLPLVAEVISGPEWGLLPQHGMQNFTGDKLWLILGLIRDNMDAEQLARMDGSMPPPAVEFWQTAGQSMYDGFMAQVRA